MGVKNTQNFDNIFYGCPHNCVWWFMLMPWDFCAILRNTIAFLRPFWYQEFMIEDIAPLWSLTSQYGIMDSSGNVSDIINFDSFEVNTTFLKSNFCVPFLPNCAWELKNHGWKIRVTSESTARILCNICIKLPCLPLKLSQYFFKIIAVAIIYQQC